MKFNRLKTVGYLTLLLASACSKQAFNKGTLVSPLSSPGQFSIPSKVDILFAEDDTGSMSEAYAQVNAQIPQFLSSIQSTGWNYRFSTIPLTQDRAMDQILAAKFDGNWSGLGLWQAPFPGANPLQLDNVLPQFFRTPAQYTGFVNPGNINNGLGSLEPGLQNIKTALQNRAQAADFLRADALLAIVVLSNGNDTSGVNFCTRSDGWRGPCEQTGCMDCPNGPGSCVQNQNLCTEASSRAQFISDFQALAQNQAVADVRMFSMVAHSQVNNCLGGVSRPGLRYELVSQALGGNAHDVCSVPIADSLNSLKSDLQSVRLNFQTRYLVVGDPSQPLSAPNPSTIEVTKYPGGNTENPQILPQDAHNGWTYTGLGTVFTIEYYNAITGELVQMNQQTGFVIELHGSAILQGNDSAKVNYQTLAGQPAAG